MSAPKVAFQCFPMEILSVEDAKVFASREWFVARCALCDGEAVFEAESFGMMVSGAARRRGVAVDELSIKLFCSKHSPDECAAGLRC